MMSLRPHACECRSRKAFRFAIRSIFSITEFTGRSFLYRENRAVVRSVARYAVALWNEPNKGTASYAVLIRAERHRFLMEQNTEDEVFRGMVISIHIAPNQAIPM